MGDSLPELSSLGAGGAFLAACVSTRVIIWVVERWRILDMPNERSAHAHATPTLGGLGIVSGFWAGLALLLAISPDAILGREVLWALLGSSIVLLLLIFDNVGRPLNVVEKLAIQAFGTAIWLVWGPHLQWITLPGLGQLELHAWGWGLTALWLIGWSNVYNFMDGIDGITATQTIVAGAVLVACFMHLESPLWSIALLPMAAAAGFLVFNFPPARIFMGDVGSVFLGFFMAVLGILGERVGLPLWIFVLILGYYAFDSLYTIARRALRGENVLRAHRQHLYQQLDQRGWGHWRIDLGVLLVTLVLGGGGYAWLVGRIALGAGGMVAGGTALIGLSIWLTYEEKGR